MADLQVARIIIRITAERAEQALSQLEIFPQEHLLKMNNAEKIETI